MANVNDFMVGAGFVDADGWSVESGTIYDEMFDRKDELASLVRARLGWAL